MNRFFLPVLLGVISGVCVGCDRPGPPVGMVRGTVTLDGTPLPDGQVTFFSIDDTKPPAGGPISDGRIAVEVPIGTVRVIVNSLHVVRPPRLPEDEGDARERVPPRYNSASELRLDVRPGDNPVTFALVTK
jgi:hypothetical protein